MTFETIGEYWKDKIVYCLNDYIKDNKQYFAIINKYVTNEIPSNIELRYGNFEKIYSKSELKIEITYKEYLSMLFNKNKPKTTAYNILNKAIQGGF